jgi:hypothetical protein
VDASAQDSIGNPAPSALDVGGSSEGEPEVAAAISDVQPDSALAISDALPDAQPDGALAVSDARSDPQPDAVAVVTDAQPDAQPDATLAVSDAQSDAASVVLDGHPDGQPDAPAPNTTLTVDKSSVDLVPQGLGSDAGVGRPITLGSSGVATVVVTNIGTAASGALAVVPGPGVSTSGCTGALAPGATCTLTIVATPTVLGQFSSTVSIWATPGATTPIQITVNAVVVPRPLISSFVASPTAVSVGESSILTAVFSNGAGTVDHGIGAVTSGVGVSTGPITAAITYTLTVANEFGDFATAQVRVIVGTPTCITQVVNNGYACGSATSCAACKDNNGNSREDGCKKGIDCMAKAGTACDSNCQANCWNLAGDQVGITCVKALQTAACSGPGC